MTTMNIEDIAKKRLVTSKYTPNSYRIFCEDIGNQSVPVNEKYSSQAPPIYTEPLIVPAQAIEDRNRPHAVRGGADFLRENAHTLNEPINRIKSKNVPREEEKRWWEWTVQPEDFNTKGKRRSQSSGPPKNANHIENGSGDSGSYQTTYQKDHGYLKNMLPPGAMIGAVNENQGAAIRHTYNPNNAQAVGIVPVNDLNSYSKSNEQQRVFMDKMSFEHGYDSRKDDNYPNRGKRQGAFVIQQIEPKPTLGTKVRQEQKGDSVWDAMHAHDTNVGYPQPKTQIYQKPTVNIENLRNQRRDPIGYFEDTKFGESNSSQTNGYSNYNHQSANQQQPTKGKSEYRPSWSANGAFDLKANDLLDNALNHVNGANGITTNGYHD